MLPKNVLANIFSKKSTFIAFHSKKIILHLQTDKKSIYIAWK